MFNKTGVKRLRNEKGVFALEAMPDGYLADDNIGQGIHEQGRTGYILHRFVVPGIGVEACMGVGKHEAHLFRAVAVFVEPPAQQDLGSQPTQLTEVVHFKKLEVLVSEMTVSRNKQVGKRGFFS